MSNTMNPAAIVEPYAATAIRGRFGYHTCDYDTYLKAKRLNRLYWKLRKAIAARWRWDRKTVNKGVMFARTRNEKGQPNGKQRMNGVFCSPPKEIHLDIYRRSRNGSSRRGWSWHTDYDWVPAVFHAARKPQPSPVAVMTEEAIAKIERSISELTAIVGA